MNNTGKRAALKTAEMQPPRQDRRPKLPLLLLFVALWFHRGANTIHDDLLKRRLAFAIEERPACDACVCCVSDVRCDVSKTGETRANTFTLIRGSQNYPQKQIRGKKIWHCDIHTIQSKPFNYFLFQYNFD